LTAASEVHFLPFLQSKRKRVGVYAAWQYVSCQHGNETLHRLILK